MRLDSPQSVVSSQLEAAAGDASTPVQRRTVHLDAFQSLSVDSDDLSGLSVHASKPVFVSVGVSSKLRRHSAPSVSTVQADSTRTPATSNGPVQSEQIIRNPTPTASEPHPDPTSLSPRSRDTIISGRSAADGLDTAAVQLGSVGRLGMTYVLVSASDTAQNYRIAGTSCFSDVLSE